MVSHRFHHSHSDHTLSQRTSVGWLGQPGSVRRVCDDAPSHPATLYRHAADAGGASWRRTLPFSSRRLWPRPRSSASTDGASWRRTLSSARSGGLGCHDDHTRLLGQPHSRVEQAHQPVLHHPDDGHGMAMAKMPLKGARLLAGRDGGVGQVRLGGELLVQGLAALAPQVGLGGSAWSLCCRHGLYASDRPAGECVGSQ